MEIQAQAVSGISATFPRGLRERVEGLLRLAEVLAPGDRAMVQAVYGRGMSVAEFARLSNRNPRAVRARLDRLLRRVVSPLFRFTAVRLQRWPGPRRRVADLVILQGLTMRQAAGRLGLKFHDVRRHVLAIRACCEQDAATRATGVEDAS